MYESLKIIPSATNGFNIEVYDGQGNLKGILEISVFDGEVHILRREKDFAKFTVKTTKYEKGKMPKDVIVVNTHNLDIIF